VFDLSQTLDKKESVIFSEIQRASLLEKFMNWDKFKNPTHIKQLFDYSEHNNEEQYDASSYVADESFKTSTMSSIPDEIQTGIEAYSRLYTENRAGRNWFLEDSKLKTHKTHNKK